MLKKISLVLASVVSAFAMHSAEININDKDLELVAKIDMGQYNHTIEPGTTFVGISYLNAHDEHSADAQQDDNNTNVTSYLELNFLMKREIKDTGVFIGIGVKSNYTELDGTAFMTIPLGLEVGYRVPVEVPVMLNAKVYYAPESLAFEDVDSFLEYRLDVSLELIERGSIIAGYRNIETNYKVGISDKYSINYNSSTYFGFRFDF